MTFKHLTWNAVGAAFMLAGIIFRVFFSEHVLAITLFAIGVIVFCKTVHRGFPFGRPSEWYLGEGK
jgi:hypothetical protein